ncbi:Ig-like domain-containing protein [Haloarcula sp. H-GB4]|uniref:Ig-like domain-containing protein n=1 Tax=Haloarcula sp. H-GB4 TaxID=3069755 RepID=UPI0027B28A58|nr:Ig-like domain-containing protein [Haloarcula sp. H-GB4]MDQ2074693.1 Ig-like domain-containing protein [Haloarcula sp. H-GB4]
MFIGADGTVLNHADYRVPEDIPRDGSCSGKDYDTSDWDVDEDGRDEEVYIDGSQTCWEYELHTEMKRWVTVDGRRISGGDTISYSGLSSNSPQQLTVHAEISVRVERTTKKYNWDPHDGYGDAPSDGTWQRSQTDVDDRYRFDQIQVSDSQEVVVTDAGEIEVEQTVVETDGNMKHLILTIQGPRNGQTVSPSKLEDRKLWSYLAMGSDYSVDGTWRTYSTRQYDSVNLYEPDGDVSMDSNPPHVPQTQLVGMDRKPTVTAVGSGSAKTQVIGYQGHNIDVSQSLQSGVEITPRQPVAYHRIVITNAEQPVTDLVTIHGQSVPVDVDKRVERRKPSVKIRQVGSGNSLQIHVEDPETGHPISGRKVNLQGAVPKSPTASGNAVTDANGDVEATRVNAYVQATVDHDDFQSVSNRAFYDKSTAARTFLPDVLLLSRLHSLVLTLSLITPLLFLYGYIRHFGFFE